MSTKEPRESVAGMHSLHYTFAFLFLRVAVSRAYSVSPPKPAFGPRAELFSCVFAKVPEKSWKIAVMKRLEREEKSRLLELLPIHVAYD